MLFTNFGPQCRLTLWTFLISYLLFALPSLFHAQISFCAHARIYIIKGVINKIRFFLQKVHEIFCRSDKSAYLCTRFRKGTLKGVRVGAARVPEGGDMRSIFDKTGTSNKAVYKIYKSKSIQVKDWIR